MKTDPSSAAVVPETTPLDLEEKIPASLNNQEESEEGSESSDEDSDSESSSDDEEDDDDNNNNHESKENNNEDGLSEYERLRLQRIERNQAQLRQLGLLDDKKLTSKNPHSHKKKRQSSTPKDFGPARKQPKREVKGKIPQEQLDLRTLLWSSTKKWKGSKTRCGDCDGCHRQDDCSTCIYCVQRNNGKVKARRCIFKVCRNKDKKKKKKGGQPKRDTTTTDLLLTTTTMVQEHSEECDICQKGNDLILCSGCDRGFHSNCHYPKLKKVPAKDDMWHCMECHPRQNPRFLLALLPNATQLTKVKVVEPPPLCMVCLDECLLTTEAIQCKACDNHFHLECHNPPLESKPRGGAARVWKCEVCKQANAPLLEHHMSGSGGGANAGVARTPKKPKNVKDLFTGDHDDDCYMCFNGGELVCCDFCPKTFHRACHIPALPAIPTGIWKCCECYAGERNRMTRCGECKACLAMDCGKCKYCLDKTKFGGANTLKKPCVKRECPYQSFAETFVEGKIPGEVTHASVASTKKRRRDSTGSAQQQQGKKQKRAKEE